MKIRINKKIVRVDADLEPIMPRFFEIRRDDIQLINEALEKNDYETITRIGHSMKGAGAGYGFEYITEIGINIEEAGKNRDLERIKRWAWELSAYLESVEVVYG